MCLFYKEEFKGQNGEVISSRSHNSLVAGQRLNLGSFVPKWCLLCNTQHSWVVKQWMPGIAARLVQYIPADFIWSQVLKKTQFNCMKIYTSKNEPIWLEVRIVVTPGGSDWKGHERSFHDVDNMLIISWSVADYVN